MNGLNKTTKEKIEVIEHFLEGGEIEFINSMQGKWVKWDERTCTPPSWNWNNNDYRKAKEPEYIPFTFEDDLLGKKIVSKDRKTKLMISEQSEMYVLSGGHSLSYEYLLKNYTIFDGTPCGKLKE